MESNGKTETILSRKLESNGKMETSLFDFSKNLA